MLEKFTRSKIIVVILHVSVWAMLFFLPFLFERPEPFPHPPDIMQQRITSKENFRLAVIFFQLFLIPLFYLNAYWLVPKFLNRKKWGIYILLVVVCIAGIIVINEIIKNFLFPETMMSGPVRMIIPFSIFVFLASTVFSFVKENFQKEKERKEKEAENLKTELSFLRSQVNPHFLFNTLNNLVSLARKKSDLLEPSLLKLSGLLQYMLYESDDEKISIHKEIEYLDNYIELQKLRFGNDVKISFFKEVSPNSPIEVVPMILIPFVENAFKHGVVFIKEPEISIRLVLTGNLLVFNVKNKYNPDSEEKDKSSGIGLNNVKRRLNLLYPNSRLEISEKDNWHIVNLSIILP
jgi:LytS/YehU family sensor histidine kinase